ncbi:trehalose-phosphatase [Novosphingobium sp. BL-52-GroH]|uniref:trehalose-phosphatase n=1 Tax=Novosphingobium sp. BL-52-GroH TaxID=3349877 RepID=UPI0038508854
MSNLEAILPATAPASDDDRAQAQVRAHPRDLPRPAPLGIGAQAALFLDFDGTLVEIADHPDAVVVAPGLAGLVAALSDTLDGRLAIVTGRSIAALEALLGPVEVAVAGSHGGEFRPRAGALVQPLADPLPGEVVAALERFAGAHGDLLVEPKPFSVAVHYRRHPEALEALLACAQDLAGARGLALKHGKQVIELAMPGSDKGTAVTRFMGLPAFAGASPLFLGDDVTDEDAFHAVRHLGGQGVLVGPMRATAASARLPDVAAVHEWLVSGLQGDTRR